MRMPFGRAGWMGALGFAVLSGYAMTCPPGVPMDRPECPHNWSDSIHDSLPIPGEITDVPEYHDCQRFLLDDGKGGLKYGEMEAIFIRFHIQLLYREWNGVPTKADSDSSVFGRQTQVVGQVLSYADYPPLGIRQGVDCLVLKWITAPAGFAYQAWMVPVKDGKICKNIQQVWPLPKRELYVNAVQMAEPIPGVARWDWDPKRKLEYIGIPCPSGWCEIHTDKSYDPSPIYGGGIHGIAKGWYDEQYLAKYENGHLERDGDLFGTVLPYPGLERNTMEAYTGNWKPAALAALSENSKTYKEKLNFEMTPPLTALLADHRLGDVLDQLNHVELCFSSGLMKCSGKVPAPSVCKQKSWTDTKASKTYSGTWYAKEVSVSGAVTYSCAEYIYYGEQMPADVRWRWQANDETVWVSCPSGCCQIKVVK